jgi:hypothetical protein
VPVVADLQRLGAVGRGPDDREVGLGAEQRGEPGRTTSWSSTTTMRTGRSGFIP